MVSVKQSPKAQKNAVSIVFLIQEILIAISINNLFYLFPPFTFCRSFLRLAVIFIFNSCVQYVPVVAIARPEKAGEISEAVSPA